jgi:hypothetical protein
MDVPFDSASPFDCSELLLVMLFSISMVVETLYVVVFQLLDVLPFLAVLLLHLP